MKTNKQWEHIKKQTDSFAEKIVEEIERDIGYLEEIKGIDFVKDTISRINKTLNIIK